MIVKQAAPDGSTLLMTPLANMVAFPHSYAKLDYDPFRDYVPVAHIAAFQLAFGIGPDVPARTLAEYVALAKGGGAYANFASASAGSLPHFFGLLFARTAGLELTHVPYKGTAQVLPALVAGEVPAAVLPISDLGALARAGKARLLATSGGQRSPQYRRRPDLQGERLCDRGFGLVRAVRPGQHAQGRRRAAGARRHRGGSAIRCPAAPRAAGPRSHRPRPCRAGRDHEVGRRQMGSRHPRLGLQGRAMKGANA